MNFFGKKEIDKLWEKLRESNFDINFRLRLLASMGEDYAFWNACLATCVSTTIFTFIGFFCVQATKLSVYSMIIDIVSLTLIVFFLVREINAYIIVEKYIYTHLREKYYKIEEKKKKHV
ncbi:MAG: hypothetical protein RSE00_02715 [Clostridia bacterium]